MVTICLISPSSHCWVETWIYCYANNDEIFNLHGCVWAGSETVLVTKQLLVLLQAAPAKDTACFKNRYLVSTGRTIISSFVSFSFRVREAPQGEGIRPLCGTYCILAVTLKLLRTLGGEKLTGRVNRVSVIIWVNLSTGHKLCLRMTSEKKIFFKASVCSSLSSELQTNSLWF